MPAVIAWRKITAIIEAKQVAKIVAFARKAATWRIHRSPQRYAPWLSFFHLQMQNQKQGAKYELFTIKGHIGCQTPLFQWT